MPTDKQRRENERRRLQRQLQRRAERDARRRRSTLIISVVGAIVLIAVVVVLVVALGGNGTKSTPAASGGSTSASPTPSPSSSSSSAAPVAAYPCTWTKSGTAAKAVTVPPTTKPPRTGTTTVDVATNRGALTFTLDRKAAPCAVESFVSLTQQKYFDNTPCHRLTSGGLSVLQCGDPTGTGTGGPGYSFGDELTGKEQYTRGVLAMANSGANTNGSQFFVVYKDSQLPASYTIFGHVTAGLSVVDKVAAAGSTPTGDGKPKLPISLTKLTVKT